MSAIDKIDQRTGGVVFKPVQYGKKDIVIETTIVCSDSPDCCGCINGKRDKTGVIVFTCNECGQEVGRGIER